jgi:hypothetical protein
MTEEFKNWCRYAFKFLLSDYGFQEMPLPHPKHSNPYQARFSNGTIEIIVLGEGYGTIANIEYVTIEGIEVATQILEPGWEPFKKGKRKKTPQVSQKEQIFEAANRIKVRDTDILSGDLTRLNEAASCWQAICSKMGWK